MKRLTTVLVSLSLLSVGLLTVAPSAAAGGCNDRDREVGGHDPGDLFHICVPKFVETTEDVPVINVTCPTCEPGTPSVDAVPPLPGVKTPGVNDPPQPGQPQFDNCIAGTDVCHPSVFEIDRWLGEYQQNVSGYDPVTCTTDCADFSSISRLDDWAEGNLASFLAWADEQIDRVSVENKTLDVVDVRTDDTHAEVHQGVVLDEACQVIMGGDASWEDCDPTSSPPDPCKHLDDCGVETSASVTTDGERTPGLLIETEEGSLFLPSASLT